MAKTNKLRKPARSLHHQSNSNEMARTRKDRDIWEEERWRMFFTQGCGGGRRIVRKSIEGGL